jgi:type VI protein secretion system component VasF
MSPKSSEATATDAGRRTIVVVSLIAAAAAVAVVSGLYWWRLKVDRGDRHALRGVRDILQECHARMHDIQAHLGHLPVKGPAKT